MRPSDEELVEAFQRGDSSAFDQLVSRWERKIQGAIYRIVGSSEDARDLCQEAFLKAYRGLGSFKREARFSSWLYQIAAQLLPRPDAPAARQDHGEPGRDVGDGRAAVSRRRALGASSSWRPGTFRRRVAAAVRSLPEEQREVIVLKEYQGLTFLEIAEALDVPVSTVKTRLYRGLTQLKQRLARQGIRSATPIPAPTH